MHDVFAVRSSMAVSHSLRRPLKVAAIRCHPSRLMDNSPRNQLADI